MIRAALLALALAGVAHAQELRQVDRVQDGDGVWLVGETLQIRVWGINAPEKGALPHFEKCYRQFIISAILFVDESESRYALRFGLPLAPQRALH